MLIGFEKSLEQVRNILPTEAVKSKWGSRYNPMPFGDLIDLVKSRIDANGMSIESENYATNDTKSFGPTQLFGVVGVSHPDKAASDELVPSLGIRSSYDLTLSHGMLAGERITVCSNLDFVGDVMEFRRHTHNAPNDLPDQIDKMLEHINRIWDSRVARIAAMKDISLERAKAADLMIQSCKSGAIPFSKLGKVLGEFDNPSFDYGTPGDTAWDLHNAFTHIQKERKAWDQMGGTGILNRVFDSELALV